MSALTTRHSQSRAIRRAGWDTNHCAVVALARGLLAVDGEDPDDLDALEVWLPVVKEQLQAVPGHGRMTEDGTHYGSIVKAAAVASLPVIRTDRYLGKGAESGNPYAKRMEAPDGASASLRRHVEARNRTGTGRRKDDCPTVARWVRDNPDATALLQVDGHVGFAHRGEAFDLRSRQRVDYAVLLEVPGE